MGKSAKVILFSLLILAAFVSCKDERGFTVTFYPNGGTGEIQQQAFAAGQTASLKANAFTRENYIFTSWNTKADGSGTSYNDCALVTVSGDMTLYAQWAVRGVSITFDSNNGSGETSSQVVPLNTPATLRANTFQNADYGFVCWNTRADGSGASFNDCAQIEVPQKMTLYAQWGVLLTDDMEEWTESTYILNSDVTINYRVYIKNSDLRLILHDGYTLKADKGIFVSGGVILTIDADGEGTGCVDAEAEADSGYAAIGGNGTVPSGIIIINGGIIEADSDIGAGIGSGLGSEAVSVTINGGKVTARSDTGAGIGGGQSSAGCPVTINGGEVAASSTHGAGIGGGQGSAGCPVTINGGEVAASSTHGAGIGGGESGAGGQVAINGGEVAASSTYGAGIGGGESGAGGQVAINGGEVAASSTQGAGIGGGESGAGGQVTINSGTVETSSVDGMGIGRGIYGSSDGTLEPGAGVRLYASDNGDNWIDYDSDETRRRFMRSEKP